MNLMFFISLSGALISRIPMLHSDRPLRVRHLGLMIVIQLLPLSLLQPAGLWYLSYVIATIGINGALYWVEHRSSIGRDSYRVASFFALVLVYGVLFAPVLETGSNPIVIKFLRDSSHYFLPLGFLGDVSAKETVILLTGFLLVTFESNAIIRHVLSLFDLLPTSKSNADGVEGQPDESEQAAGRYIGALERFLLYVFLLNQAYTAMAFILAAKSFTRFRALQKRSFAEYVLIGTLLSASLSVLISLLVLELLKASS